jgi:hypothetical protein
MVLNPIFFRWRLVYNTSVLCFSHFHLEWVGGWSEPNETNFIWKKTVTFWDDPLIIWNRHDHECSRIWKLSVNKNFCFYAKLTFEISQGTTVRLNETRFGPKKKLSMTYLGPKNLDTFWCIGWAWNWQIIFRFASIHGRAYFILLRDRLKMWQFFSNEVSFIRDFLGRDISWTTFF